MKLEKVTLYSSLALLGGFLVKELLKARIRARTMALKRSVLQGLIDDPAFVALFFNPFYDNRTLAKDRVSLVAFKKTTAEGGGTLPAVPLETVDSDKFFSNERDYSAYKLTADNIKTVLDHFSEDPGFAYVLFVPKEFEENPRYLAYELIPADNKKQPLRFAPAAAFQTRSAMATVPEGGIEEAVEAPRIMALTMNVTGSFQINPSPPATSNFS